MIVVDTSAIVDLLVESPVNQPLFSRLASVREMHVPHLIDVEFLAVVRKLVGAGLISDLQAHIARQRFSQLPLHRYPHYPQTDRVWALRPSITAYDAQFVALAETLGLALVTCDRRLAGANGHSAIIESFAR